MSALQLADIRGKIKLIRSHKRRMLEKNVYKWIDIKNENRETMKQRKTRNQTSHRTTTSYKR
jgi:hypothetical protein